MDEQRITVTLTSSNLYIVMKGLQRYRMRIEEVGAMGWYDNPDVTRQEIARVDAILAELEAAREAAFATVEGPEP